MSFASAISDLFSCGRSRKARESEIGPLDQDAATSEPAAHEAASTPAAPPVEEKTITTTTTTPQVEDHAQSGQEDAGRIAYTALPDIRPTTANWMGDFTEDRDIQLSVVPEKAKPSSGWVVEQRMLVTMPSSSTETETKTSVPEPEPETAQVTPPVRCPTPEQEPWNSTPAARSVTPEPAVESKLEVRSVSPIALRPATAETRIEPELEAQFLAEAFEFTPFWTDETELDLEVKQPAKAAEEISLPASDKTVEPEVIEPKIAEPEVVAPKIVEPTIVEPTIVAPAVVEPIVEPVAEPVAEPTVAESKIVEPEIVVPVVPAPKKNTPAPTLLNMPPEVRNKIYENMTEEGPIRMCRHDDPALMLRDGESARAPKRQFYNFTQVCRAIRNEFLPVYARKTQYIIDLWGQKANLDKVEQLKGQVQMDIDAACFDMEPIDLLPLIRSLSRTGRTDYRFTSTEGVVFRSISEIVGELNKLLPAANGSNKNWIDAVNGPMKKIDLHLFPHDDIRQYYRFRGAEPLVRVVYPSAKSEEWMKQASKSAAYEAYLRKTGLDKFQMHVVVGHASRRTINEGRLPLDWRMSYQLPMSSSDRAPRISMDIAAARMSIDRSALN